MNKDIGHTSTAEWAETLLPLALSVILPGLNLLNTFHLKTGVQLQHFGLRWLVASIFLLLLWYSVKWVREAWFGFKWAGFIVVTLFVSASLYGVQNRIFDNRFLDTEPTIPWQLLLKLSLGALLFWLMQSSLKTKRTVSAYRLEMERLRTETAKAAAFKEKKPAETLLVPFRDKVLPIAVTEVACFLLENESVYLVNRQSDKFYLNQSLEALQNELDERMFYRINRQTLVNRRFITSVEPYPNRKIMVNLSVPTAGNLIVSRLKVPEFKQWLAVGG